MVSFWSNVTQSSNKRTILKYADWSRCSSPPLFLQHVELPREPWTEFRSLHWMRTDLCPILQELTHWARSIWSQSEAASTEEKAYLDSSVVLLLRNSQADDAMRFITLLCTILEGLAATWDKWSPNEAAAADNTVVQQAVLVDANESSTNVVPDDGQLRITDDNGLTSLPGSQETGSLPKNVERYALECLNLVIEGLASGVLSVFPLAPLVLDRTNEGLLFFEALATRDRRAQYDILVVLEQLLYRKVVTEPVSVTAEVAASLQHFHEERERGLSKTETNKTSSVLASSAPERVAKALVQAPHAIGNLMSAVEYTNDDDSTGTPPRLVKNQCLAVLKSLASIHNNLDLKTIMTFQSLPEVLISTLRHELLDPDVVPRDTDLTLVGMDCLDCLQSLIETTAARKYVHQTGLLQSLFENLETLLEQHDKHEHPKSPKGIYAFYRLFLTFVEGSEEDRAEKSARLMPFLNLNTMGLILRSCARTLILDVPPGLPLFAVRVPFRFLTCLFDTASSPLLLALFDPPDSRSSPQAVVTFHDLIASLFTKPTQLSFYVAKRFLLLETLEKILASSSSLQLHVFSTCWASDTVQRETVTPQPFGIMLLFAYERLVSAATKDPTEPAGSPLRPPWLEPSDKEWDANSPSFDNVLLEHSSQETHLTVWLATRLVISMLRPNPLACEKALDLSVRRIDLAPTSFSDLIIDCSVAAFNRLSSDSPEPCSLPVSGGISFASPNELPFIFSNFTSLVILLQLLLLWSQETPRALQRWADDARFYPFLFGCVGLGDEASYGETTKETLTPCRYWSSLIQGLAVALLVDLLQALSTRNDLSNLTHLLGAVERRFSLKVLVLKYSTLVRQRLPITKLSDEGLSRQQSDDELLLNLSSHQVFLSILDPVIVERLVRFQPKLEPLLVRFYLDAHYVVTAPPSSQTAALAQHSFPHSPMTASLTVSKQSPSGTPRIDTVTLEQEKNINLQLLPTELETPGDVQTLKRRITMLQNDVHQLRVQLRQLMDEQQEQQETYEAQCHYYRSRVSMLKKQLSGVVQCFYQLEAKFARLASRVPQEYLHDIGSYPCYPPSQPPQSPLSSSSTDQLQALLELLGILADTFPNVKAFIEQFDLDHANLQVNSALNGIEVKDQQATNTGTVPMAKPKLLETG